MQKYMRSVFPAALFSIAKMWRPLNVHQQMNYMDIYIYTHTHISYTHKFNGSIIYVYYTRHAKE